jgi:hypothetical protein
MADTDVLKVYNRRAFQSVRVDPDFLNEDQYAVHYRRYTRNHRVEPGKISVIKKAWRFPSANQSEFKVAAVVDSGG